MLPPAVCCEDTITVQRLREPDPPKPQSTRRSAQRSSSFFPPSLLAARRSGPLIAAIPNPPRVDSGRPDVSSFFLAAKRNLAAFFWVFLKFHKRRRGLFPSHPFLFRRELAASCFIHSRSCRQWEALGLGSPLFFFPFSARTNGLVL